MRASNPLPYDEELLEMVERTRELLSHQIPNGDRLEISKVAYRVLIAHLEKTKRAKTASPRPAPAPAAPTKRISRAATREMFERHGDQCCYVDERTGIRCSSRAFIQRDHRHMRVHGGGHGAENLRPMCQSHNLWLARKALGRHYIERRICFRQRKRDEKTTDVTS